MAKYTVCTVLDMVAGQYGRPFFAVSEGSALRGFADEVNSNTESMLYKHPSDFQLFMLGEFDDSNAQFELISPPKLIVSGAAVVNRPE